VLTTITGATVVSATAAVVVVSRTAAAAVVSGTTNVVSVEEVVVESAEVTDFESLQAAESRPKATNAAAATEVRTVSELVGRVRCDMSGSF